MTLPVIGWSVLPTWFCRRSNLLSRMRLANMASLGVDGVGLVISGG